MDLGVERTENQQISFVSFHSVDELVEITIKIAFLVLIQTFERQIVHTSRLDALALYSILQNLESLFRLLVFLEECFGHVEMHFFHQLHLSLIMLEDHTIGSNLLYPIPKEVLFLGF